MRIVDTHLHLIYPDRFSYPWLAGAPEINKPWSNESYWAEALSLGIEAAIHMEVDVLESQMVEESRFVLGLDRVVGAIANGRPEHDGFEAHLEALAALGKVVGIRRLIQGQPAEMSQTETFRANLRLLPKFGMSFDICAKSHELQVVPGLVAACPDVQFILNHCGNPKIGEGEWESWATQLKAIAALPNVVCKVSGIPRQREARLDGGTDPPLRRVRHRDIWLGPRGVGQRPSGGDAVRQPDALGECQPRNHGRRQRGRAGKALLP